MSLHFIDSILRTTPRLAREYSHKRHFQQLLKATTYFRGRAGRGKGEAVFYEVSDIAKTLKIDPAPCELAAKAAGLTVSFDHESYECRVLMNLSSTTSKRQRLARLERLEREVGLR